VAQHHENDDNHIKYSLTLQTLAFPYVHSTMW